PNYDPESIAKCEQTLEKAKLRKKIMVDCSHGNSNKDHRKQPSVFQACVDQVLTGNRSLCGMMVESNLFEGNQKIPADHSQLKYGVSVTDQCIDWQTTEDLIMAAHHRLKSKNSIR